jgi:hypothetical protein
MMHDEWVNEMTKGPWGCILMFCFIFSVVTVVFCCLLLKLLALPTSASDQILLYPGLWNWTLRAWRGAETLGNEAAHPCIPSHGGPKWQRGGSSFLLTVKANAVFCPVSAKNVWPQLPLKFRGTWKNFSELLISICWVLWFVLRLDADQLWAVLRLFLEYFLDMAGDMGNHRVS